MPQKSTSATYKSKGISIIPDFDGYVLFKLT